MHTVDPTSLVDKSRLRRVEKILVSQPAPESEDSPYLKLAKKYNIVVDFFPFIRVEPIGVQDFRNQKVEINAHTAVIFTSRNAVDHFFQLAKDTRTEVDPDMKYFCVSEQTAYYLQKYIVVRKRKIFTGKRSAVDLIPLIKKHKKEKYLFPCSNLRMNDIPTFLTTQGIYHHELIIYCTLPNDLSTLEDVNSKLFAQKHRNISCQGQLPCGCLWQAERSDLRHFYW